MNIARQLGVLALCAKSTICLASVSLDFNSPISGTINDINSVGTGFTHRLPSSGSAIPSNDGNLNLDTAASQLLVGSTRSDFNTTGFGRNLSAMEAPALQLSGIGNQDFLVKAKFINLRVDQLSDQIGIFVGASVNNVARGGVHDGYQAFLINSQNGIDVTPSLGSDNQFQAGHDAVFEIARIGGAWSFSWHNLSQPNLTGGFQNFLLPALDSQNDLYVGVFNLDARNTTPQTATLDYFYVLTGSVPEPSALTLGIAAVGMTLGTRLARRAATGIARIRSE